MEYICFVYSRQLGVGLRLAANPIYGTRELHVAADGEGVPGLAGGHDFQGVDVDVRWQ